MTYRQFIPFDPMKYPCMTNRVASAILLLGAALGIGSSHGETARTPALASAAVQSGTTTAPAVLRSFFVAIPPQFKELKRAPVLFPHDLHTRSLKEEGCGTCHPAKDGTFTFSFPIQRNERNRNTVKDSFHDACIACHTKRSGKGWKTGPLTCEECHSEKAAYRAKESLPPPSQEYESLRDPFHQQCTACHLKSGPLTLGTEKMDWKTFSVQAQRHLERATPRVVYDYYVHDKHQKALEKRCELCHHISPELKKKLAAEGKVPTGQDWLRQEEEGKSWKQRESAHGRCLNCHLQRRAEKKSAGPVGCGECHVDQQRPPKMLANIQPPDYGDKKRILIDYEKSSMAGVPFDHQAHIAATRACGDCHHDTLESCRKCHTAAGAKAGAFITLADSYHSPNSKWSCVGCHATEQRKPDCAGCHHLRKSGLVASACAKCHTGNLESLDQAKKLPDPASLFPADLKDELDISALQKDYAKARVQHTKIVQKLTEISNNSKLAMFFHQEETTLCSGCHHLGPVEKKKPVPACTTCHAARTEPFGQTPVLLGAYHQACLGCHRKMAYPEEVMPQKCTGCHKEKGTKP